MTGDKYVYHILGDDLYPARNNRVYALNIWTTAKKQPNSSVFVVVDIPEGCHSASDWFIKNSTAYFDEWK